MERVARREAAAALVMSSDNAKAFSTSGLVLSLLIASAVSADSVGRCDALGSAACAVPVVSGFSGAMFR
jgi:hypothetical protein